MIAAVALGLELVDQLGAALLDDPARVQDVDEVGLHEVQDALVVGDDQDAHLGLLGNRVDGVRDDAQGVDVEAGVGLVEHGDLGLLERELEHLHALLLAAREAVVQVARGELVRDVRELHRLLHRQAELLERDRVLAARTRGAR